MLILFSKQKLYILYFLFHFCTFFYFDSVQLICLFLLHMDFLNDEIEFSFYFFQVTILVNNAGYVYGNTLMNIPDHAIEHTFNVNILSQYWVSDT